ncbi:MAG: UDP-galactopyranose mutase [Minisyncoccales bacterium]
MSYDYLIVGAGLAGIVSAERLSSRGNKILLIDKREHIGGNCYDYFDNDGNYIQKYGPHIFHTKYKEVWDYIKNFIEMNDYKHKVFVYLEGKLVPLLFNLNSVDLFFDKEKSDKIKEKLINSYGKESKITIFNLGNSNEPLLQELFKKIYRDIFVDYTCKQWDLDPSEMDKSVLSRVPIFISNINNYFPGQYQGVPVKGFTDLFNKMLGSKNIHIKLNTDFFDISNGEYKKIIYTGPLDRFFNYKFGKIRYRRLKLSFEKFYTSSFQINSVINYPSPKYKFTRITEYNKFLSIKNPSTVISKEFPSWDEGTLAWPLQTKDNLELIDSYLSEASGLDNVTFFGRLAEGKYYDMDTIIKEGLRRWN